MRFSLGNNPNPEIDSDTLITSSSFTATVYPSVELKITHHFQKKGGEKTESSKFDIIGGNPNTFFYKVSHGLGQRSSYFPYSSTRVQLVKRLINTPGGGFYEYNEDNYSFGTYRQVEFGPGYRWRNNLVYMGARLEKAGAKNVSFLYLVSVSHQLKYIVGQVQVKLYGGPQYVFNDNVIKEPEFGYRIKINGQWLPPGLPNNMQLSYGINGLLINRATSNYRRFGAEIGVVYQY